MTDIMQEDPDTLRSLNTSGFDSPFVGAIAGIFCACAFAFAIVRENNAAKGEVLGKGKSKEKMIGKKEILKQNVYN